MKTSNENMTTSEMVAFWNANCEQIGKPPVKRFATKAAAIKRIEDLRAAMVEAEEVAEVETEVEVVENEAAATSRQKIAAGVARSWKVDVIRGKRMERSGVEVDGQEYTSVANAFDSLGLDPKGRIAFRMKLKKAGSLEAFGMSWTIIPINY